MRLGRSIDDYVMCFLLWNFEFNTIEYNTVINIQNKTVNIFSILLINVINILRRIIERLFK